MSQPPMSDEPPDAARAASGLELSGGSIRVLVVEDELLISLVLEQDLGAAGFSIVGPFTTLAAAMKNLQQERANVAVLDINVCGEMSYALADELSARSIPFMFLSGYSAANVPYRFKDIARLSKPYDPATLVRIIHGLISTG